MWGPWNAQTDYCVDCLFDGLLFGCLLGRGRDGDTLGSRRTRGDRKECAAFHHGFDFEGISSDPCRAITTRNEAMDGTASRLVWPHRRRECRGHLGRSVMPPWMLSHRRRRRGDIWIVVGSRTGCTDRLGSLPSGVGPPEGCPRRFGEKPARMSGDVGRCGCRGRAGWNCRRHHPGTRRRASPDRRSRAIPARQAVRRQHQSRHASRVAPIGPGAHHRTTRPSHRRDARLRALRGPGRCQVSGIVSRLHGAAAGSRLVAASRGDSCRGAVRRWSDGPPSADAVIARRRCSRRRRDRHVSYAR